MDPRRNRAAVAPPFVVAIDTERVLLDAAAHPRLLEGFLSGIIVRAQPGDGVAPRHHPAPSLARGDQQYLDSAAGPGEAPGYHSELLYFSAAVAHFATGDAR